MFGLLGRLLGSNSDAGVRRFTPRLEVLNGRTMPSVFVGAVVAGGDWEPPGGAVRTAGWQPPPTRAEMAGGAAGGVADRAGAADGEATGGHGGNAVASSGGQVGALHIGEEIPQWMPRGNIGEEIPT